MDARGKKDGFNIVYHLNDLGLPAIYSSLHTNAKTIRERRLTVQRFVAAIAESVRLVEDNPEKAKAAVAKALKVNDEAVLQSSYEAYAAAYQSEARRTRQRRGGVGGGRAGEWFQGNEKAPDLIDGSFVESLDKSGFLKELWDGNVP